ncbi:MAG: spore germination protein [Bacillales bacterium]|jgi:spore germination protein PA|nr:spore germination protein [Bacillales bacterium]
MPAMVGFVNVISIGSSSIFNIGDVFYICPNSSARTFAGAGSFNTGDSLNIANYESTTNVNDPDQYDMPIIGNF